MKFKNILYAILCFYCVNSFAFTNQDEFLNEIRKAGNLQLDRIFNDLKSSHYDRYFYLMEEIYNNPAEYVHFENIDIAKIHAGDILVQGYQSKKYPNVNLLDDIYYYAKESALSDNFIVALNAISVIGLYDTEDGFNFLIDIIENGGRKTAPAAAIAVASMCASFDQTKFDHSISTIKSEKLKIRIMESGYRVRAKLLSTSWCERKKIPKRDY